MKAFKNFFKEIDSSIEYDPEQLAWVCKPS